MVKPDTKKLEITVSGVPYVIEAADIDGLEWRDIKRATDGMTPKRVFQAAGEMDFEAIAALLWIVRRREEDGLTLDAVLKTLSFAAFENDDEDDEPVDPTSGDGDVS